MGLASSPLSRYLHPGAPEVSSTEHMAFCFDVIHRFRPPPSEGWLRRASHWIALALLLSELAPGEAAESRPWIRSTEELKRLSLDELINQEVLLVSREPERLAQAPSGVVVITPEAIRRAGATSLPEALRLASNLQVAQATSRDWAISARGFNNTLANKMLVMIDGRTVYTPLFAGVFWDVQDTLLEDIDRIEVVSGPGGALWGENAVNGVINVVTRSAKETQGGLLLGGGGSELTGFGGVRYGGRLAKGVYYRVYAKAFDRDGTVFHTGQDATNGWHMLQGGWRVDWEAPGDNLLTFQGDYYNGRGDQPHASRVELRGGNGLVRWTHLFSDESDLRLQLYYDRTYRLIPPSFGEDLDTFDIDAQHRFAAGDRHRLVWGLGYRVTWDDVENSSTLAFLPAKLTRQLFSTFVQDRVTVVEDQLHLTLGSRFAHNDYTGWEFQPSLRLAWTPAPAHLVWGAVSRAVRAPSRIDEHFFVPGQAPYLIEGGPGFEAEELLAYGLGYRVQPDPKVALRLTGFYHDYDQLRSTEPLQPPERFPVRVANGLEGETYGLELGVDYHPTDWWRLRAGYTHLQLHVQPGPGSRDTSKGSGESHDANHHVSLWSMWDLPARLELDLGLRYVSHIANQQVPAYAEVDARLGWRPRPNLEVSIVGQNLLHSRHVEFGARPNRYEIERSVYGKVTWRF